MARLFFALWPDAAARDRLAELAVDVARDARGKPVPVAHLHLTLAFLGEVDAARADLLGPIAGTIEAPAFRLELDGIGSFPRARVAWAGCSRPAEGLLRLQSGLAKALAQRGFVLEDRPYAPHLTLVRKTLAQLPPASMAPIDWLAGEFALVRSQAGRYETVASWRLG